MTLYDYLKLYEEDTELTVWDSVYDMETYFYNTTDDGDLWTKTMMELSKLLTITEIKADGVIVNLTEVVETNMEKLKEADLFISYDIDDIMCDMDNILAGYVSEKWLETFVKAMQ